MSARVLLPVAVCSLLLMAGPAQAAVPSVNVSPDPTAANVAAYGGTLAWSRRAPSGEYRLVLRKAGIISDATVRPFRHPVDADLGPGRRGGAVAVYARCRSSRRCDLYRLDLGSGRERKLRSLAGGRPEFVPSTWRGRYAFGRAARISGEGTTARDVTPFRGSGLFKTGRTTRLTRRAPYGTDLRRSRVAYITDPQAVTSVRTQQFSRRRRGRDCRLVAFENGGSSSGESFLSPVIYGDYVYWLDTSEIGLSSSSSSQVGRRRLPSRRCGQRGRPQRSESLDEGRLGESADSLALDRGQVYFTSAAGVRRGVWQADLSTLGFSDFDPSG